MGLVGTHEAAFRLAASFRRSARQGRVLLGASEGHRDGWGLVYADGQGTLRHAGRSTQDATKDPAYEEALARLRQAAPERTVLLAHVRKATLGARSLENTHPFVEDGYAFCHNGTVEGLGPGNDSRILFARLLARMREGASPEEAIAALVERIPRASYSSLTLMLSDGRALWALRAIGTHPDWCAPERCPGDYYTLAHARLADGTRVLAQEPDLLGLPEAEPVPEGHVVSVREGKVQVARVA